VSAELHSILGASNSSRWMNCPGSIEAEKGLPDEGSKYAQEGTAAHALAKLAWDTGRPPSEWLGDVIETVVVEQDMVDAVTFYLEYIQKLAAGADTVVTEQQFSLARLKPPVDMFGTTDFNAVHVDRGHIDIADLKYGKGVRVNAEGNPQGRYYGLGSWLELFVKRRKLAESIKTITVHIVQPRINDDEGNPSVSTETLTLRELKNWAALLLEAARNTQVGGAPRRPGAWCRFCTAKPVCLEFRNQALAVAQVEFSDVLTQAPGTLALPTEMTPEQIAKVLDHSKQLTEWLKGIEAFAQGEIERGRPIPGYALKPKRATRKWIGDTALVVSRLQEKFGADDEDLYERNLKSPAQVEKTVGKGNIPEDLIVAESSGFNLSRDTDPRAVLPAASEFSATR
jgi:hypothetical protein